MLDFEPVAYNDKGRAWLFSNNAGVTINGAIDGQWRVYMDSEWSKPFATLEEAKNHAGGTSGQG